ncbi:MAG: UDP-glucose 4-epimerase [Rickettsiales bacterium]|nr:UDP-glucose 4-epimerase [Rickettsiales bacterium]
MLENILITGGAGYVGSALVPKLLKEGYKVTVLDLMIYGQDVLKPHKNLKILKGDIRDQNLLKKNIANMDAVIHLACISNDPSFELNKTLGRDINLNAFEPLVKISRDCRVKRFIYASSSSVYGIKKETNVNEEMNLEPLTDYSKFKADCEKILQKYQNIDFTTVTIRPATVCGFAPRQRLDLVVNILTNLAYHKREITVFGGDQLRPNIHIDDMVDAYLLLLKSPDKKIAGKIFNAGYENFSVEKLSKDVKDVIGDDVSLIYKKTEDNRSYHISSEKIKSELGFIPKKNIKDAVIDLQNAFKNKFLQNTLENEFYFNIKRMKNLDLK